MIRVAVAMSAVDEAAIEQLLDGAGIAYEISLDADESAQGVCSLGRAYLVRDEDAAYARAVISSRATMS